MRRFGVFSDASSLTNRAGTQELGWVRREHP